MKQPRLQPFADCPDEVLAAAPALLSDVDGTLTTGGRLAASTVAAMERLAATGMPIVLVTGRPAGWAECFARLLPVHGCIAENGGTWFLRRPDGGLAQGFFEPEGERQANRKRLQREVARVLRRFPEARLSLDSAWTQVDLAIDHHEEARLPPERVDALEGALRERGLRAVRSGIHVNVWVGEFDKRAAALRLLEGSLGVRPARAESRALYLGDHLNDGPMFVAFRNAVGVANVRKVLERLGPDAWPRWVARGAEGAGAVEVMRRIARIRGGKRASA